MNRINAGHPRVRDIHGDRDHDHRGPNVPRDNAIRPRIGHSADDSNTHPRMAGGPIVPAPSSTVRLLHPSIHRPKRSLRPGVVAAVHSAQVEECGQ